MMQLQHNVVSLLYTVKGMIETYMIDVEEGRYQSVESRLERAEGIIKKSYSTVDGALRITRRLGSVLRLSNKETITNESISLAACWQVTRRLLSKEFRLDIIEIVERIPEEFPEIQCTPKDLQEILYHLGKNALQAIGIQGKIIIRSQLKIAGDGRRFAVISLSDTGPGISGDRLSRLFKPFYTTKPVEQGNGLGLYLTRELVAKNQGTIEVSSYEGCGTTFTLQFPLAQNKAR